MVTDYHRRLNLKIDFIAKTNTIIPTTSKAAPANKLIPEFEPVMDSHINRPSPTAATEIIISSRCARRIKTRDESERIIRVHRVILYNGI